MNSTGQRTQILLAGFLLSLLLLTPPGLHAEPAPVSAPPLPFPLQAKRILFLGDSITHAGRFIDHVETQLRLQGLDPLPEMLNLGLSSETCTGLSEPDHPFPRPNVQDRIDRALELTAPDVVVACYGMNDGIYHPFSEERFAAYQRGIQQIIDKSHAAGAKVVLLTPPPFDAVPPGKAGKLRPADADQFAYFAVYENYDDVIRRYGQWILQQDGNADLVIDLHTPITQHLKEMRKQDPDYTLAPDGVHPNATGHQILAETLLDALGVASRSEPDPAIVQLVSQRNRLLHDAWLSHVGHKRPGVKPGLPLPEAETQAAALEEQINKLVEAARTPQTSRRDTLMGTWVDVRFPASLQPGELRLGVEYEFWIPRAAPQIRGVIVHQHGCGVGASVGGRTAADDLHWQALAQQWDCVLMGSSYEAREGTNCRLWCDPRNGSGDRFLAALALAAETAERPEIATVPWALWGHSGGGFWASLLQTRFPERIVAIWLQSGTAFATWEKGEIPAPELTPAVYQVPVMGNPGVKERDHPRFRGAWNGILAMQKAYRDAGAPFFEFAPDPRTGHECGDSRYLAIPFFNFWLRERLPAPDASSRVLTPVSDATRARWDEQLGPQLAEFCETGAVSDTTPPPRPLMLIVSRDQQNGTEQLEWIAQADLESGLLGFEIWKNNELLATIPEKPVNRFGRPLFQGMSYHDTPTEPLIEMKFVDKDVDLANRADYSIRSINTVGLKSDFCCIP